MKVLVLAGLFTVAAIPFASAAEAVGECQVDDTARRASQIDNGAPGGSAPPPQTAQVTSTAREVAAAQAAQAAQREAAQATRVATPERRRGGKRIPDAELIGPRGAL